MSCPVHLSRYNNSWYKPGRSILWRAAWLVLGQPVLHASWIPFSSVRIFVLRLFGATIGEGVTVKPSVTVKYPWALSVGDHCWIGEQAWIDNLTSVRLDNDVCISQGAYLCTGNHDWSDPRFGLMLAPIHLHEGSWAGARSVLLPGVHLGRCAVAAAGAVVTQSVPDFAIVAGNPAQTVKRRNIASERDVLRSAGIATEIPVEVHA